MFFTRISILWVSPLDSEVLKKLLNYVRFYEPVLQIDITAVNPERKITRIPPSSYNPIFNTKFSYFMQTQDQLYSILFTLFRSGISYLNETGYHSTGDILRIYVPSMPNDDLIYTFKWQLGY